MSPTRFNQRSASPSIMPIVNKQLTSSIQQNRSNSPLAYPPNSVIINPIDSNNYNNNNNSKLINLQQNRIKTSSKNRTISNPSDDVNLKHLKLV
jgi:hypothetical protein